MRTRRVVAPSPSGGFASKDRDPAASPARIAMSPARSFPTRMLVDLPTWVGDQMMALPAVHRLVDGNRGGDTVLHTTPAMRRLLELVFPETRVAASPRRASPGVSALDLCRGEGRFEVGVTLRNAMRAKILVRLAARWTAGSCGEGARLLLSRGCRIDRGRHQVFDGDPILHVLGLPGVDSAWRPPRPAALDREGEAVLDRAGLSGDQVVGLAPATARGQAKRWPADRFGRLGTQLQGRDLRPLLLIGPGEETVAEEVRAAAGCFIPVVGPDLDVAGLVGVIGRLDTLVCNDSGPMHIAARFGTKVVTLFGPSDPSRTAPLDDGDEVLCHHLSCAPCTAPLCPLDHHECMRGLSVDDADAAVMKILDRRVRRID